jgi:hypothetical protein
MRVTGLGFAGSGAATGGNSVTLRTPGVIRVDGALAMTGAGAGDTLRLDAGQRLEVATDRGGRIDVGAAGALAGVLDLRAANIWVGTADLLGQLAQNVNFAGRDPLLAAPSATPDAAGALTAGRLTVSASSSFLVQNSGTLAIKAGFTAGTGGMVVAASGTTPLDVVINGRVAGTDGAFIINKKTVEAITFVSGGEGTGPGFTETSTVNDCLIGRLCGLDPDEGGNVVSAIAPNILYLADEGEEAVADKMEELLNGIDKLPIMRTKRLVDLSAAVEDVIITDPVTGGGNPALWLDRETIPSIQP